MAFHDFFLLGLKSNSEVQTPYKFTNKLLHAHNSVNATEKHKINICIYIHCIYIKNNQEECSKRVGKMEVYGDDNNNSERRLLVQWKGIGIYNYIKEGENI